MKSLARLTVAGCLLLAPSLTEAATVTATVSAAAQSLGHNASMRYGLYGGGECFEWTTPIHASSWSCTSSMDEFIAAATPFYTFWMMADTDDEHAWEIYELRLWGWPVGSPDNLDLDPARAVVSITFTPTFSKTYFVTEDGPSWLCCWEEYGDYTLHQLDGIITATQVPEPALLALTLLGIGGLARHRRA
jgi:hypothetical protein